MQRQCVYKDTTNYSGAATTRENDEIYRNYVCAKSRGSRVNGGDLSDAFCPCSVALGGECINSWGFLDEPGITGLPLGMI